MGGMGSFQRHVLVVGAENDALERIAPMLRRAEFNVHTAEPSPVVFDLVLGTSFELVLVSYPLRELDLDDLIDALRREGSWCQKAALVLLAEPDHLDDAGALVDLGVNRAVSLDWPEGRLHQAIARSSRSRTEDLAPGAGAPQGRDHGPIQEVSLPDRQRLSNRNAPPRRRRSRSGNALQLLLRHPRRSAAWSREPARSSARTNSTREGTAGLGIRFVRIAGEGEEQLESFVMRNQR